MAKLMKLLLKKGVTKEPLKVVGQTDETGTLVHFVPDAEILMKLFMIMIL